MESERVYLLASSEIKHVNQGLAEVGHLHPPAYEFPGGTMHAANGETTLCGLRIGDGELRLWPNERFGLGLREHECRACRQLAGLD